MFKLHESNFFTLISNTYITPNQCLIQSYSLRVLLDAFYMPDRTKFGLKHI